MLCNSPAGAGTVCLCWYAVCPNEFPWRTKGLKGSFFLHQHPNLASPLIIDITLEPNLEYSGGSLEITWMYWSHEVNVPSSSKQGSVAKAHRGKLGRRIQCGFLFCGLVSQQKSFPFIYFFKVLSGNKRETSYSPCSQYFRVLQDIRYVASSTKMRVEGGGCYGRDTGRTEDGSFISFFLPMGVY